MIAKIGAGARLLRSGAFGWMWSRAKPWRFVVPGEWGERLQGQATAQFTVCGSGSRGFSDSQDWPGCLGQKSLACMFVRSNRSKSGDGKGCFIAIFGYGTQWNGIVGDNHGGLWTAPRGMVRREKDYGD